MEKGETTAQDKVLTQFPQSQETDRRRMLNRRPKLLFLAYRFPPARAVSTIRTWNIAKYLARLGWDVTVVTPHPSLWRHVDNPKKVDANLKWERISRISTDHRWRCLSPYNLKCWNSGLGWVIGGICRRIARNLGIDRGVGWNKVAEQACSNLTVNDVDIILATVPPFAPFSLARRLSDRLGRPYVLDYRDLWNVYAHKLSPRRLVTLQKEANLLAGCTAVTTVSHSLAMALDRRYRLGSKLHVVTNGFDPEDLVEVEPYNFGHFAIVYTGNFYPPKLTISPVMAALKLLKENKNGRDGNWYFHYYGGQNNHVSKEAERFGVMDRVVLHGSVPWKQALSAVRGAGVAVVITRISEDCTLESKGIVTGKIYEALGLETPILLISPPGSDARAIAEGTGLAQSFTGNDTHGIAYFLEELLLGSLTLKPTNLEPYTWPNIAKKLDSILRAAAKVES